MINDIYRELYHYDENHTLVMNMITRDILMCKTSKYYDRQVYEYLMTHPDRHIPTIIDYWESENGLTVVEEFIQGHTFDSIINDKTIPDNRKIDYVIEICRALSFLHKAPAPIIYRDIKPTNIVVSTAGDIKIVDFDAAKTFKDGATKDTVLLGTEGFAAPEQYGFGQSDARTDIYTIGILLKEMFPDNKSIRSVAAKATRIDPNKRYQTMDAFIRRLERLKITPGEIDINPLLPIPGFRQRKPLNITLAIPGYLLFIYSCLMVTSDDGDPYRSVAYKISALLAFFFILDCCSDWTGIWRVLPFVNHPNRSVRIVGKTLWSIVTAAVLIVTFDGIASLMS